ncbi:hypothetical protein [Catenulispora yoronensis]
MMQWAEIKSDERTLATPLSDLRHHRMIAGLWAALSGLCVGVALGVLSASVFGASSGTAVRYASVLGLTWALGTLSSSAWGTFTITRFWLALARRLPFNLLSFLHDAHRRGVVRQDGAIYRFRHDRLQETLRNNTAPADAKPAAPEPPEPEPAAPEPATNSVPSWLRHLQYVPLARLGVQVSSVVAVFALLGLASSTVDLNYQSGQKPSHVVDIQTCSGIEQSCIPPEIWSWSVPSGSEVFSAFTLVHPRNAVYPLTGFYGSMKVTGCSGAAIEVVMRTDAQRWTIATVRDGHEVLPSIRGALPSSLKVLTFEFRRLDAKHCTAALRWTEPSLSADAFFYLKQRLSH